MHPHAEPWGLYVRIGALKRSGSFLRTHKDSNILFVMLWDKLVQLHREVVRQVASISNDRTLRNLGRREIRGVQR